MCADAWRFHVLVVDDCADTTESFAELLGFHGYDARAVGNASAALDMAGAGPVDVAVAS